MGKRAAPKSPGGSPSKSARMQVSPAHDECAPVFALLAKAEGLTEESGAMLRATAPHCLATPSEDRHAYQKEMIQMLTQVVDGVEAKHQAAITAIEIQISEAERSVEAVRARPTSTEADVVAKKADRDAREEGTTRTSGALAATKAALAAEQALVDGHAAEVKSAQDDHESYSRVVAELWLPLKAGFSSKDWRVRNKLLEQFMGELKKLQLGAALESSVPVALKTKAEDRGSFAKSAIDFADSALQNHVAALTAKVGGAGDESARRLSAAQTKEAEVASALAAHDKAVDDFVAAENTLLEAEASHKGAREAADSLESAAASRDKKLIEAKASLVEVQELVQQFKDLCVRSRPQSENAPDGAELPVPSEQ